MKFLNYTQTNKNFITMNFRHTITKALKGQNHQHRAGAILNGRFFS